MGGRRAVEVLSVLRPPSRKDPGRHDWGDPGVALTVFVMRLADGGAAVAGADLTVEAGRPLDEMPDRVVEPPDRWSAPLRFARDVWPALAVYAAIRLVGLVALALLARQHRSGVVDPGGPAPPARLCRRGPGRPVRRQVAPRARRPRLRPAGGAPRAREAASDQQSVL